MKIEIDNWKAQIRKGYLELCILLLIDSRKRIYGLELLNLLKKFHLPVKEGTLYPLLSRMSSDALLNTEWETQNSSGHPRKFYSLTKAGKQTVAEMKTEFDKLIEVYNAIKATEE